MSETRDAAIELRFAGAEPAASPGAGVVSGYAVIWGPNPRLREEWAPGVFRRSLEEQRAAGTSPPLLWSHDPSRPVGRWVDLVEDGIGLRAVGQIAMESDAGREAFSLLRARALDGLSVGFRVRRQENGPGGVRRIVEAELIEISLVSVPAVPAARVQEVRGAMGAPGSEGRTMDTEQAPVDTGEVEVRDIAAEIRGAIEPVTAELRGLGERLATVERRLSRPGGTAPAQRDEPAELERRAFRGYVRSGREVLTDIEARALRVADDASGGYTVPQNFVGEVIKQIVLFSPIRQVARVANTAGTSVVLPKLATAPTAAWVTEVAARAEATPAYGQQTIGIHEGACYIDVSTKLLEDSGVDIEAELTRDLAAEFGRLEGAAFVSGNGTDKPLGFLQAGASVPETITGDATLLTTDGIIDLFYAVPQPYRGTGTWLMGSGALAAIRKMKDTSGAFIWQASLAAGQPETVLGRPVLETVDMPAVGAGTYPVAFGDWSSGFRIYDRVSLAILRDPYSQATTGTVRFHARRRVGGAVVLPNALRKLKVSAA